MKNDELILLALFCEHHNIEVAFINELENFGLAEIIVIEQERYLASSQLASVEKMVRLHYELQINMEGIDAISHLLDRIETLQTELTAARNKLLFFD